MIGLKDITKSMGSQSFLLGVGVAAVGYFLGPQIKQSLRPVLVKGAEGAMMLGNKTKQMMEGGMKKMDNVVFEGAGAGMTNNSKEEMNLTSKLMQELREERESSRKMMEELKNSIDSIRGEIAEIRSVGVPLEKGNNPLQSADNPQ
jgi:hypothetical protein